MVSIRAACPRGKRWIADDVATLLVLCGKGRWNAFPESAVMKVARPEQQIIKESWRHVTQIVAMLVQAAPSVLAHFAITLATSGH